MKIAEWDRDLHGPFVPCCPMINNLCRGDVYCACGIPGSTASWFPQEERARCRLLEFFAPSRGPPLHSARLSIHFHHFAARSRREIIADNCERYSLDALLTEYANVQGIDFFCVISKSEAIFWMKLFLFKEKFNRRLIYSPCRSIRSPIGSFVAVSISSASGYIGDEVKGWFHYFQVEAYFISWSPRRRITLLE